MFGGWGRYLSIALPGLAALCLEWWTFEVVVMLAGVLPRTDAEVSVSVMGVSFDITTIAYMLPAGIGGGAFSGGHSPDCTVCMQGMCCHPVVGCNCGRWTSAQCEKCLKTAAWQLHPSMHAWLQARSARMEWPGAPGAKQLERFLQPASRTDSC
jgi:hypothetical protein